MLYYDILKFKSYVFYLIVKDDVLISCTTNKIYIDNITKSKEHLKIYTNWLKSYFKGNNKKHNFKFNYNNTNFTNLVHKELLNTVYGNTITYKEIAINIKNPKSFRAVGKAISKNNLLIFVPCHRVIKSDGTIGGFNSGITLKKELLNLEKFHYK